MMDTMKLTLRIKDRITYWNILASIKGANFATWRLLEEAKKTMGFSEEDYQKYSIEVKKDPSGSSQLFFKNEGSEAEYDINDIIHQMVTDHLKDRDAKKTLDQDEFALVLALNLSF